MSDPPRYSFGPVRDGSATIFRLWAPGAERIELVLEGAGEAPGLAMERDAAGWHGLRVEGAVAGTAYCFRLPDGLLVADPASRLQLLDAEGPSVVVDADAYNWVNHSWPGRPWHEAVIYELNVGTFSPAGTFDGAREGLRRIAELGFTAIELMPVADFPGRHSWGYDGVLPYAPDTSYGTPHSLRRLIDEAHGLGLMVFLDVVYNHFGPQGNYLHAYAPGFFTDRYRTPWGDGIDFGRPEVRDFFIENAIYWLSEYRFDGLRLDAVHAIKDDSEIHVLHELARRVHARFGGTGRQSHLVIENDDNATRFLGTGEDRFAAQWNDDFHHAAHVLLTSEAGGYYIEYAEAPLRQLARILTDGLAWQGEHSPYRDAPRGEPTTGLGPTSFINFLQNHDQIGNRAFGDRIATLASPQALRTLWSVLYLQPSPVLAFMGDEWASRRPFLFFCDFQGDLAQTVRDGRRQEFARFAAFSDPAARSRIPDPAALSSFEASRLDWPERGTNDHPLWEAETARLLRLRRRHVMPRGDGFGRPAVILPSPEMLMASWEAEDGAVLTLLLNAGHATVVLETMPDGRPFCTSRRGCCEGVLAAGRMPAMTAAWFLIGDDAIDDSDIDTVFG